MSNQNPIPAHEWTHDSDEVLILRCIKKDGRSYGGFVNPTEVGARLIAPEKWDKSWGAQPSDWRGGFVKDGLCGGGIHGWAWGIGVGDCKDPDWNDGLWQVWAAKPENVCGNIEGVKVKFGDGLLRYSGDWYGAMMFILDGQKKWVEQFSEGQGHATGDRSASSATGDSSASSATGY